ncbi:hypothetical protein GGF43_005066 [Coemansia sp. RSA 2618]|nr:hypothetical protein GGF43_005066 [Coemansia sp. RSA 2618]
MRTLPLWYAESRFLQSEALRAISDSTDSFVFGRMFKSPSNSTYRDGNHLRLDFAHLEFPSDTQVSCADPPAKLAQIVARAYNYDDYEGGVRRSVMPRCVIDCTLNNTQDTEQIVQDFERHGFACERQIVDPVLCLRITPSIHKSVSQALQTDDDSTIVCERARARQLRELVACNARSFGYDAKGDVGWLDEKLRRQIEAPEQFCVLVARDGARVVSFVVIYTAVEKAPRLSLVQVVGTDPAYRRRGLAARLLRHAVSRLRVGTSVYVDAGDHAAVALYQSLGFEEVGEIVTTECVLSN